MQISSPLCKLARQDTTTFAFRPIPENISFLWKTLTLELKLKRFYPIIKMTTLKDFEAYFRVRDYMVGNDLTFEDILKDFDDRIITISVSCDGVTKKFYSIASAVNYMGVSLATAKYAYSNKRDTIRKMKGRTEVFHVEWE